MNFLIKNLELELEEGCLLTGEQLLLEGKATQLREQMPHLWLANVDGFEVEMQVTPTRVKAWSCECGKLSQHNMCGHVAAGLLALRRVLSEKKANTPVPRRQERQFEKLTISSILKSVSPDELAGFVGEYAKGHRHFALALQARFAAAVPVHDSAEKYAQLLDHTILAYRKKHDTISPLGANQLLKTLKDLAGQAADAISMLHFAEAWAIYQNVLLKVTPLIRKVEGESEKFHDLIASTLGNIEKLLDLQLAPELKEEIWTFFLRECTRPPYRIHDFSQRIFNILDKLGDDPIKARSFLAVLNEEGERKALPTTYQAAILYAKLTLLERKFLKAETEIFLLECLAAPELLIQTVDVAVLNGAPEKAKLLAEHGLRLLKDPSLQIKFSSILLSAALQENNADGVVQYARQLFLATFQISYFRLCQQYCKNGWDEFFEQLEKTLLEMQAPDEILAAVYAEVQHFDKLVALLQKNGTLELLLNYDRLLAKTHESQLSKLYKQLLEVYLSQHIGTKPTLKVQGILAHLQAIEIPDVAEDLKSYLQEHFPARLVPIEEPEVL